MSPPLSRHSRQASSGGMPPERGHLLGGLASQARRREHAQEQERQVVQTRRVQPTGLALVLRRIQTGHIINTMWEDSGTWLCGVQMFLIRLLMIWPLKAITPTAYAYWTRKLFLRLSGRHPLTRAQPGTARGLIRAAVQWGLEELFSLWMGMEVVFLLYYFYKRRRLQAPAIPPVMPPGTAISILRKVFQTTADIQAYGRLLQPSRSSASLAQLTPQGSSEDLQQALLHPKANESNVEQLLREWDSMPQSTNDLARAVSERDRVIMDRIVDDAELRALKHAEISGWFLQRRTGGTDRWPAARVGEIKEENMAEWMAWAFFNSTPEDLSAERFAELQGLIEEGRSWSEVHFQPGYNTDVQAMRLTMDPIPSEHRPLIYYLVTALAFPVVTGIQLGALGFKYHRSGTLSYWLRKGTRPAPGSPPPEMPIVFCHGVGVNLLPYAPFITELLRNIPAERSVFLVSLPHISMRIKEDVPSSAEMVACICDMLQSWGSTRAHFVGHSFGSIVMTWMAKRAPSFVGMATFIDPVCFLLIKPDVCYNFMYRRPTSPTQLLIHYFVARELYIAHSLSRNFFWYQNLLWPDEIQNPVLVVLCGKDSIVPAHSVRRYLAAYKRKHGQDTLRLLWFPDLGHGEINFGPVGVAACKRIVREMLSLENSFGGHAVHVKQSPSIPAHLDERFDD